MQTLREFIKGIADTLLVGVAAYLLLYFWGAEVTFQNVTIAMIFCILLINGVGR